MVSSDVSGTLDDALSDIRVVQNRNNAECLLRTFGFNSRQLSRDVFLEGKAFKSHVRHLGPHFSCTGSKSYESGLRIQAANKAWYSYKALWSANVSRSFLLLLYKGAVISTLLSGLTAFALTGTQIARLETFHHKKLRRIAKGAFTDRPMITARTILLSAMRN